MQRYTLPVATTDVLGGIKVGDDFDIGKDGTLQLKESLESWKQRVEQLSNNVKSGKAMVSTAITDKGILTDATATFQTMADNISRISVGISYAAIDIETSICEYSEVTE